MNYADNGSLVYTNENCIGCNKCISACSCVGACVAVEDENGANRIEVSGDNVWLAAHALTCVSIMPVHIAMIPSSFLRI